MKKHLPFISLASVSVLSLFLLLSSCGGKNDGLDSSSESASDSIESGTVNASDHDSPTGTESSTVIFIDKSTEKQTEAQTETEKPTETEKETEPPAPIISLRYMSYGNGTCGVSGIGNCTDTCIVIPERSPDGDIVTSIEDKAFFENTDIRAVQIPSTVTSIGDRAFGGCTSLVYISVDTRSKAFSDVNGVLYSKDGSKLILFPAASGMSEISISSRVKVISNMAFFGCDSLKSIKYGGTLENWGQISIGDSNYGLYSASITFSNTQ